jgi:hypothetical protein
VVRWRGKAGVVVRGGDDDDDSEEGGEKDEGYDLDDLSWTR